MVAGATTFFNRAWLEVLEETRVGTYLAPSQIFARPNGFLYIYSSPHNPQKCPSLLIIRRNQRQRRFLNCSEENCLGAAVPVRAFDFAANLFEITSQTGREKID
jgi:hypothetical protein